jgi:Flp pilus assembly protein TadG
MSKRGSPESGRRGERGAALVFLTSVFAVLEFGRLLWVHNALTDAARRGARYAVNHTKADVADAQRMAVYGTTDPGAASPMVSGLTPGMVKVTHSGNFNVGEGVVTVRIDAYDFKFVVPLVGTTIRMPEYASTLTAESAGKVPGSLP